MGFCTRKQKVLDYFLVTWFACFIYVFMEWLFFVTKSSMLNYFSLIEKISALFFGSLIVFLITLPVLIAFFILAYGLEQLNCKKPNVLCFILPALLYAGTVFLMVENFTYTIFGFSSESFPNIGRYVYGIVFVCVVIYFIAKLQGVFVSKQINSRIIRYVASILFLIGTLFGSLAALNMGNQKISQTQVNLSKLPNILILSSDGINSRNMSAFGYERETTPFIKTLLKDSLVFENHFTNAANTTGSIISLLTGKLPTTTRVVYPPDYLRGADAYEHLPGILKEFGYMNADISIDYYGDTEDLNMQNAFIYINKRSYLGNSWVLVAFSSIQKYFPSEGLFLRQSFERISNKLSYVFGLSEEVSPYKQVTLPEEIGSGIDDSRVQEIYQFIHDVDYPFFIHAHLLATHGPKFRPKKSRFSSGKTQNKKFMVNFYDDAIRDFDDYVREVVAHLKSINIYDNTLLIINTDHGMSWGVERSLPLIMKFPESTIKGRRSENSQRIDIAPTILEYLGVEVPHWMEGDSLLSLEEEYSRLIFSSVTAKPKLNRKSGRYEVDKPKPPFYTLGRLSLIDCHVRYEANLVKFTFSMSSIEEHTKPCAKSDILSKDEAIKAIANHLDQQAYDIQEWLPEFKIKINE